MVRWGGCGGDSPTSKRCFCPPFCAVYTPCCSIRAVSAAQVTPDQHPKQTQIEQRPAFGNIAKRQTRPSPTQSTFSVGGARPDRRCAILVGSLHSPRLAGQLGIARTGQGRVGEDVRSGRPWRRAVRPTRLTGRVARRGSVTAVASRGCELRVFASPATNRDGSHPGTQRARLPRRPRAKRSARAPHVVARRHASRSTAVRDCAAATLRRASH